MNIHFKTAQTSDIGVSQTAKSVKNSGASTVHGASQDRATFSTSGHTVASLVQGALSTPVLRQDKIDSIRSSITAGTYNVDNVKIAGSILSEDA